MEVKYRSHIEANGAQRHTLTFPTGMGEDAAKQAVADADKDMWDYMYEVGRSTQGGMTVVEYELRVTPKE